MDAKILLKNILGSIPMLILLYILVSGFGLLQVANSQDIAYVQFWYVPWVWVIKLLKLLLGLI